MGVEGLRGQIPEPLMPVQIAADKEEAPAVTDETALEGAGAMHLTA